MTELDFNGLKLVELFVASFLWSLMTHLVKYL